MYSTGAAFFHHLKFFGFGELEVIDGSKGRYEDSIYAFYMGGNRKTGQAIYCKYAEHEGDIAEKTTIESLELYKGERFLYLFDFGDEWEFNVELVEYDEEAPVTLKPIIIESKGKSPKQYHGGW